MTSRETFQLATKTLRRNPLRSALTLVGITIGVAAVVTMVAVGNGARASIEEQVVAAGMNVITVVAGNYQMKGESGAGGVEDHNGWLDVEPEGAGSEEQDPAYVLDAGSEEQDPAYVLDAGSEEQDPAYVRDAASEEQDPAYVRDAASEEQDPAYVLDAGSEGQDPAYVLDAGSEEQDPAYVRDAGSEEQDPAYVRDGRRAGPIGPANDDIAFVSHPEDDPMEKHNHPTARQRLGDAAAGLGAAATLTRDDAVAIRSEVRGVQYVSAGVHESARVVLGDRRWFTRLHGAETDLPRIRRSWVFKPGRFFSDNESENGEQVVVLGTIAHQRLFGASTDPIGKEVRIWNQPFRVIGVVASTNWATTGAVGDDQFDAVYVPLTAVHRLLNLTKLNSITMTSRSAGETTEVSRRVTALLRQRHGIGDADPDDFVVRTQASVALGKGVSRDVARAITGNAPGLEQLTLEQLSKTLERSSRTMTLLLASVAGVSLLVGGIGIMNIMLLSVTERTREIGLRMAIGARSRDVLMQFLAEAVTLSLIGGVIGVALAIVAASGVERVLRWSADVSIVAVTLAVLVAGAVGVFFGLYPARQAARLDPIDALRFE